MSQRFHAYLGRHPFAARTWAFVAFFLFPFLYAAWALLQHKDDFIDEMQQIVRVIKTGRVQ